MGNLAAEKTTFAPARHSALLYRSLQSRAECLAGANLIFAAAIFLRRYSSYFR
jgi:hypothetical protein